MKNLTLALGVVLMFSLFSCGLTKSDLEERLDNLNSECPMKIDNEVTILEAKYDAEDNCASITSKIDMEGVDKNNDIFLKGYSLGFIAHDKMKPFIQSVIAEDAKLKLIYKFKDDQEASMIYTSKELSQLIDNPRNMVEAFTELQNDDCPEDLGDGVTLKSVILEKDNAVSTFEMKKADIKDLKEVPAMLKKELSSTLKDQMKDEGYKLYIESCIKAKIGVEYRCVSKDSDDIVSIVFSPEDLEEMLGGK